MARPLRLERVGCWYHITARGNERRDIFRDDEDRRHFLSLLEEMVNLFALRLHAYVLMNNHYHLVIELTEANLSRAIHWLNVSYTVWFNRRHRRSGHLFQGRFKSVAVEPERWGLEVTRYVHLNPVRLQRLGLGKEEVRRSRSTGIEAVERSQVQQRISVLRRYRWSSFRAYAGIAKKPAWLTIETVLALGGKTANASERYRQYCEEAIRQGLSASPWENVTGQVVLGSERFVARLVGRLKKTDPRAKRLTRRPGWEQMVRGVEKVRGEKWEQFRDRHNDPGRDLVLYLGRQECGMSISQLSERAGIKYVSAAAAVRRFSEKLRQGSPTAALVKRVRAQMYNV